ncbi:DNA repair protein RAD51 homolog 2 isoform X2 [Erinaceus europaeus]|uniref:DNA repair protein RAD51 homolog 2 isoform X2 n=1 Tax=Erinaceus europaeus TaxID=9365 RepID=A0ABM3W2E4_ERIEU|nr:DNA repair protein RAD51 homolog 2 isoform X2 [Erinaceus europaeus]XP_060030740.1 DNA repair protein RAD51 homolog 2 isoform X2 [Erinaceus europaeus]XP_060030741.1 DNA repair protein RAD51 homolog 2 isoform X2 [Erinaceus europaeus]XP_060030742.1 DNA repair protein RAD51 homolog 2 isoform X2 [Erinaceus europaeus]XP_060030743.1 DNA repair protein RAD51 homolog 2 isoform X2 [Erinaceus europaeus]
MGSKKLRRVGLSQEMCDRLSRHQIVTCKDFLCLSPLELMKMTGLSYGGVHELLCMVSRACAPQMQTAYEIQTQRSAALLPAFLSTTLPALDEALHGGVACGSLTEITGPPGCGKTQFCIMMSVLATLPTNMGGLGGAVVYIDTESAFSAERLVKIAESRFPRYFDTEEKLLSTSSKVHLYQELSCDAVLQRIESLEEEIISKGVKMVIIDSVASVVRKEFDTQLQGNMRERSKFLAKEAASLKYLAKEFSIPVILTNQITTHLSRALASQADLVSPADDLSLSEGTSGSSCVTAALGNTWSHCVNTRLILQNLGSGRRQVFNKIASEKICRICPNILNQIEILIAKSPLAPFTSFVYTIKEEGLVLQD